MRRANIVLIALLALAASACGGSSGGDDPTTTTTTTTTAGPIGDASVGLEIYNGTCIACHGPGGSGIEGLGKPLTTSTFVAGLTDAELLAFLDEGRASDDPLNTTGILMPPRGGNPALTDSDLIDIIAYMRTLNG